MYTTALPEGTVRACLLTSVSCSRCVVNSVNLLLNVLQERLESKAMDIGLEQAREAQSKIIKMEVGSRVMPQAHAAMQKCRKAHLC